jgi:hypothetical protein
VLTANNKTKWRLPRPDGEREGEGERESVCVCERERERERDACGRADMFRIYRQGMFAVAFLVDFTVIVTTLT